MCYIPAITGNVHRRPDPDYLQAPSQRVPCEKRDLKRRSIFCATQYDQSIAPVKLLQAPGDPIIIRL
jgi:hypothetical protein